MTTLDEIDWNELAVVARSQGHISVWKAWKRSLAAFNDPRMWEGPEVLDRYFERLDDDMRWGPAGYGVIVIDYDKREVLSVNDYSNPDSFFLLNDNVTWEQQENPALAPLRALAARPDQWPYVNITLMGIRGGKSKTLEVTLDQIVPAGADESAFLKSITQQRGEIELSERGRFLVMRGSYLPPGWVQHDDRGQEMPDWMIGRLEALCAQGFPPPDWSLFDASFESSCDISPQAAVDLDDEELEDYDGNIREQARRYLNLRAKWDTGAVNAPKPKSP